jgi:hypothetical protein
MGSSILSRPEKTWPDFPEISGAVSRGQNKRHLPLGNAAVSLRVRKQWGRGRALRQLTSSTLFGTEEKRLQKFTHMHCVCHEPSRGSFREDEMPQVSDLFFKTAAVFLVVGLSMGLQMAISGDHNVIGAHAHANLLGWVTMALFGVYYALNPAKAATRLARLHFRLYAASIAVMVPSLYLLYLGYAAIEPLVAVTSLTAFAAVLLFVFIVFMRPDAIAASPGAALAG